MEEGVRQQKSMLEQLKNVFDCGETDVRTYSPLALAYMGDAVYELLIRTVLVERANRAANELHKRAIKYVNARTQAQIIDCLMEELTPEELAVYKRGRNANSHTMPKNAVPADYRKATGMEAMLGYLYLQNQMDRILYLVRIGLEKAGLQV